MTQEVNQAKRYLGIKFGYGQPIQDGTYAVPCTTSRGKAFMRIIVKDNSFHDFHLFWDEKLTVDWYENQTPPVDLKESKFADLFRKIEKEILLDAN